MVAEAVAREAVCALRGKIARIEGIPAQKLEAPGDRADRARGGLLASGAEGLDRSLGGGLPRAALTEILTPATRDSAAAIGFVLGLANRLVKHVSLPLLWIGTAEIFREGGFPYPPGLVSAFGLGPERLLIGMAEKLPDMLWMAEEAAALPDIGAVVIELRGNPGRLDLTATRRLHWRASHAGRPVFLIRQGAEPEPTAAPVRLAVRAAPAAERTTLAGPLQGSLGLPAFTVAISKCRAARTDQFIVEWNSHELAFQERRKPDPRRVVSLPGMRKGAAAASGSVVVFAKGAASAAGAQPSRREHAARLRSG